MEETAQKVDVILPVYNGETTLKRAVDSILSQTHAHLRLILINDGSTDSTQHVIDTFEDPRILKVHNESNLGLSASRNRGLLFADAPFIALMDADDVSLPCRLETQIRFLERNPDISILGSHFVSLSSGTVSALPTNPWVIRRILPMGNCLADPTIMIRSDALERSEGQIVPLYDSSLTEAMDYDLWLRMIWPGKWRAANLASVLLIYDDFISDERLSKRLETAKGISARHIHDKVGWPRSRFNPRRVSIRALGLLAQQAGKADRVRRSLL